MVKSSVCLSKLGNKKESSNCKLEEVTTDKNENKVANKMLRRERLSSHTRKKKNTTEKTNGKKAKQRKLKTLINDEYDRKQCRRTESNCRHKDFQSFALPTELQRLNSPSMIILLSQYVNMGPLKILNFRNKGNEKI